MKLFSSIYKLVEKWSQHRHASRYLSLLSFTESSFFPIPPDLMLLPMSIASPHKAFHFASITTISSVAGALLGYLIGYMGFDLVGQLIIDKLHLQEKFDHVVDIFNHYGVFFILVAAFTPLPYKLFTIAAGVLHFALIPFVLVSIIGRGLRFYLIAAIAKWFGLKYNDRLYKIIDLIGWITLLLILTMLIIYTFIIK